MHIQQDLSAAPASEALKQQEKEVREQYVQIIASIIDLIKQQSKADWIGYRDDCTKFFFARAKQRKISTYILRNFYQNLLGPSNSTRTAIDPESRLAKFTQCYEEKYYQTCPGAEEDLEHVFFKCGWAQAFWQEITNWWPIPISLQGFTSFTNSMKKIPGPRRHRNITLSIIAAAIY
ncbi:hypothetical protein Cgig2_021088 [Carnegiea gigantea]|uniref:Reverse transcriptase zinc-binding domain-containing protein n=1 Tax=Carnegiea gigantea TaxID=171969 RepID=A0A9Q1Q5S3_9CARY|nr:hypothetical protein Cgig2_021088 [Carnegiea gigantea]